MTTSSTARKQVTIYEVAEHAGVSISTVSRVLRRSVPVAEETRDRVLRSVAELKYVPTGAASSLATKRQPALGLVLPHLVGEYYSELLIGFELAAADLGYTVTITLANPRSNATEAVSMMAERVEGLAFMARSAATDDLVASLAGPRAVVTVARRELPGVPAIFTSNRTSARNLVRHLIDTGRRRILFVGTPEPASDLEWRHRGYLDALEEAGLPASPAVRSQLTEEDGGALGRELLDQGLPHDAIVCGNDLIALALVQTLGGAGVLVPEQVAVTGWDDTLASRYLTPALTTVSQPVRELARTAVARLHAQLTDTHTPPESTVLDSHVVHRQSCCAPTDADDPTVRR